MKFILDGRARYALALALLGLGGCAKDRAVYMDMPISRLESPEAGERWFDAGPGYVSTARIGLTSDQTQASPDPVHPTIENHDGGQLKLSANAGSILTLSGKAYNMLEGGQAKLMPLAPLLRNTPVSLALTFGYAGGHEDFDYEPDFTLFGPSDASAHTSVRMKLRDYAAIGGIRLSPAVLLYGGPFCSSLHYYGDHQHSNSNENVSTEFSDRVNSRGANAGLAFTPASWLRFMAEVSHATVHAGQSDETFWRPGVSLEFMFGRRREPAVPGPALEPVRVVPAERPPAGSRAEGNVAWTPSSTAEVLASGDRALLRAGAAFYDRPVGGALSNTVSQGEGVTLKRFEENRHGRWWYVARTMATAWVREEDVLAYAP